ncbi:hypothetical protein FA15DRAFT_720503 [Coprinopsis marcescibilis]|uniref:G-protein coupled receptors family 1 profile domain-containing protein n=1 Tax=Coprinopsis marcescibilis TaxID=230819 RepID=A0A5C3KJL2_COPMA|nr:hypothetical protein FA15DRAFT_720503 [Coprinopsis marcescibilis]
MEAIEVTRLHSALPLYRSAYSNCNIYMAVGAHLRLSPEARKGRAAYTITIEEAVWDSGAAQLGGHVGWMDITRMIAEALVQLAGEGLLLHRCLIIWDYRKVVKLPISTLYVSVVGIGVAALVHESIQPVASVSALVEWRECTQQLWAAYFVTSVILNCVTTGMIALPIIRMRRRFRKLGLITPHQQSYIRILAILIESSLPFTLIGTAAVIVTILSTLDPGLAFATELANGFWIVAMNHGRETQRRMLVWG